jgi:diadenosine tetraphosphate (Ap4A) HIT family hydrolase
MDDCKTCELLRRRDTGEAPLWDSIYRTDYWDVVHALNSGLLGWTVLVVRRHIAAIDELTEAETLELGKLIREVSIALKQQTGCTKTYVAQFAEGPGHQHVHFHVVPRMADQPDDHKGPSVFKYLGVPNDEWISEDSMNAFGSELRHYLANT